MFVSSWLQRSQCNIHCILAFVGIRGNGGGKGIRLKISPIQANESPKAKRICKQFKLTNSQHFCRIKMGEFFDQKLPK